MAFYQDRSFLIRFRQPGFDRRHSPGTFATAAGIYRCDGCGIEIAVKKGHALPSAEQHEHGFELGPAKWQLIVSAL